MSCRHDLANTTCSVCYSDRGGLDSNGLPQITPRWAGDNLDAPRARVEPLVIVHGTVVTVFTPEQAVLRLAAVEQLVEDALESAAHLLDGGSRSAARDEFELAKKVSAAIDKRVVFDVCWDWHCWASWHREVLASRTHVWSDARRP